jgi:hypothetical protein
MRNFVGLGIASLLVFAGTAACGDDDSNDGSSLGGSGGSAGSAGGGGMSGASGMGGASGAGGTGGSTAGGGSGGSGAPPPDVSPQATCTGCVELIAPVNGPRSPNNAADEASYIFSLGAPIDFSSATITWRLAAVEPNANYTVVLFAQNGQVANFAGAYAETTLNPAIFPANQFREVVLDLSGLGAASGDAGAPDGGDTDAGDAGGADVDAGDAGEQPLILVPNVIGGFDTSQVIQFGIFVGVNEAFSGSATVRVAVDRVTVAGVPNQPDRTFTAGTENLGINQYNVPPGTPLPFHHP